HLTTIFNADRLTPAQSRTSRRASRSDKRKTDTGPEGGKRERQSNRPIYRTLHYYRRQSVIIVCRLGLPMQGWVTPSSTQGCSHPLSSLALHCQIP
ncbi:hypothetical protein PoMZ_03136, partial [Pyricularia oryzae]